MGHPGEMGDPGLAGPPGPPGPPGLPGIPATSPPPTCPEICETICVSTCPSDCCSRAGVPVADGELVDGRLYYNFVPKNKCSFIAAIHLLKRGETNKENAQNADFVRSLKTLREDVSIHRTNLKYCGKSPKIRFPSYFHIL